MKLIVGLGNPGGQYDKTRHNIGFYFLDHYFPISNLAWKKRFNAMYVETMIEGTKVVFVKPQTYMNNSGEAVSSFVSFYKIPVEDILIISDDLDLPIGSYRLRAHGSSGGHNGLKSIETHLKSQNYKRLKIGISNCKEFDTIDYVLGKFSLEEVKELERLQSVVSDILTDYQRKDYEKLMCLYNHHK